MLQEKGLKSMNILKFISETIVKKYYCYPKIFNFIPKYSPHATVKDIESFADFQLLIIL